MHRRCFSPLSSLLSHSPFFYICTCLPFCVFTKLSFVLPPPRIGAHSPSPLPLSFVCFCNDEGDAVAPLSPAAAAPVLPWVFARHSHRRRCDLLVLLQQQQQQQRRRRRSCLVDSVRLEVLVNLFGSSLRARRTSGKPRPDSSAFVHCVSVCKRI